MITFQEFTNRLAFGHLKNTTAVCDQKSGILNEGYQEQIMSLTNQALSDLFSRQPILSTQVDLTFVEGQTLYPISETGFSTYLSQDIEEFDFTDCDYIRMIDVFDATGERHTIDSNGHIVTPAHDTIRFSKAIMERLGPKIRIRCQMKHTDIISEDDEINHLNPNLIDALQLMVSSLFFAHMGGEEYAKKGDQYYGLYLHKIGEDGHNNLSHTSEIDTDCRFSQKGFV